MKRLLPIVLIILSPAPAPAQSDNPFMEMTGRPFADYCTELHGVYDNFNAGSLEEQAVFIEQAAETARVTGLREWEFEKSVFELSRKVHCLFRNEPVDHTFQNLTDIYLKQSDAACEAGLTRYELLFRSNAMHLYWDQIGNYEMTFELSVKQARTLEDATAGEMPEAALYYVQIANYHYYFKDYEKAILYFGKALEQPVSHRVHPLQAARNGMGLCYKYGYNDLDRSDVYFRSMTGIEYPPEEDHTRDVWEGIAKGNLGHNMFLRGDHERALPLLAESMEKTLRCGDQRYSSGTALTLAEIYLAKKDRAKAREYIDSAVSLNKQASRDGRMQQIYRVLSKYHAAAGDHPISLAYMDSTLLAKESDDREFSALQLLRAEQRGHLYEQQAKDEELRAENIRSRSYLSLAALATALLVIVSVILLLYFRLYCKKRDAYRELAAKAEAWAMAGGAYEPRGISGNGKNGNGNKNGNGSGRNGLSAEETGIMNEVHRMMSDDRLFADPKLTLESMAERMKINRNVLSKIINNATGKNFNQFVNEYRTGEAIRIIMSRKPSQIFVNELYEEVGFNSRTPFYLAFKQATGLSPTEFIKNKKR